MKKTASYHSIIAFYHQLVLTTYGNIYLGGPDSLSRFDLEF